MLSYLLTLVSGFLAPFIARATSHEPVGFMEMFGVFDMFAGEVFGPEQRAFIESNTDPVAVIIGRVIGFILSFVGAIMVILIVYGGYTWMTARGDTEQVQKGKDIVINAVTGLVVVMLAYAITFVISYFVIRATLPGTAVPT